MREQIERVIAELQTHLDKSDLNAKAAADEGSLYREGVHQGRGVAFSFAIKKLKDVLTQNESETTNK